MWNNSGKNPAPLINPFATSDVPEEKPSFSFYSDPLAAYTTKARGPPPPRPPLNNRDDLGRTPSYPGPSQQLPFSNQPPTMTIPYSQQLPFSNQQQQPFHPGPGRGQFPRHEGPQYGGYNPSDTRFLGPRPPGPPPGPPQQPGWERSAGQFGGRNNNQRGRGAGNYQQFGGRGSGRSGGGREQGDDNNFGRYYKPSFSRDPWANCA